MLPDVRYRQWVLSWPKRLRVYFLYDDDLFRAFSTRSDASVVYEVLTEWMQTVLGADALDRPDARPAMFACDQTFGTLLDWNPHLHAMVSHGLFRPDGTFVVMIGVQAEDLRTLERVLASRLLTLLVRREKLTPEDRKAMLSWPHLGFSLDASVGVHAGNREELRRLLCYTMGRPSADTRSGSKGSPMTRSVGRSYTRRGEHTGSKGQTRRSLSPWSSSWLWLVTFLRPASIK